MCNPTLTSKQNSSKDRGEHCFHFSRCDRKRVEMRKTVSCNLLDRAASAHHHFGECGEQRRRLSRDQPSRSVRLRSAGRALTQVLGDGGTAYEAWERRVKHNHHEREVPRTSLEFHSANVESRRHSWLQIF